MQPQQGPVTRKVYLCHKVITNTPTIERYTYYLVYSLFRSYIRLHGSITSLHHFIPISFFHPGPTIPYCCRSPLQYVPCYMKWFIGLSFAVVISGVPCEIMLSFYSYSPGLIHWHWCSREMASAPLRNVDKSTCSIQNKTHQCISRVYNHYGVL